MTGTCPHGVTDDICVECSGVRYLGDLQRLQLEPGDILVLRTKELISADTADRLHENFKRILPGHKVIVLDAGIDVG